MSTVSGFKQLARDVTDLCELQLQLLAVDGKVASRRAGIAGVAVGLSLAIAVSAITTLLIGCGWALHESFNWTVGSSLAATAAIAVAVSAVLLWIAYRQLKKALAALDETRSEFAQNLRWLKSLLGDDVAAAPSMAATHASNVRFSRSSNDRIY
ncbi:MAG: phage holin family protein [Planctomycetaceae bacterium]